MVDTCLDGLWFIQYTWSPPAFLYFSKSFTSLRMTRPQMPCQATTSGDSEWGTFSMGFSPSLSSDLQSLWRDECFWFIIILNKYLSSGQRQNGLVVNANVNSGTRMRRSLIMEISGEATWSWSTQGRHHLEDSKESCKWPQQLFCRMSRFCN